MSKNDRKLPLASVIIVSWNAKKYLEQCLQSVLGCSDSVNTEIIVVDNDSSDGSQELVRQYFPNVKMICNSSNVGFAKANNIGICNSQGEYLFLINSDVVVHKNCLVDMIDKIEGEPRIGVLGPKIVGIDGRVQRSCMGYPTLWNTFCRAVCMDTIFPHIGLFNGFMLNNMDTGAIREVDVINGCFWLIRRAAVDQIGMLDENFFIYAEDIDWCRRFNDAGWKVVYYPLAQAVHYGGASSSNAPIRFYIEMQNANLKYWGKHHGRASKSVYQVIIALHQLLRAVGYSLNYLLVPKSKSASKYKVKRSVASILALLNIRTGW